MVCTAATGINSVMFYSSAIFGFAGIDQAITKFFDALHVANASPASLPDRQIVLNEGLFWRPLIAIRLSWRKLLIQICGSFSKISF